tara:strand:+ start:4111 stop:4755 length:645 start_codon:yes stop_codon:yes gene_type:complete
MNRSAVLLLLLSSLVLGQDSSTNNTQEGNLNNSYGNNSTVSSNNQTDTNTLTKNYNGAGSSSEIPATSAISPTYMSNGAETCLMGSSSAVQTSILGFSGGDYKIDEECNRRRDAKVLSDLGMKVAAVSRMCGNIENFRSMFVSGTPCPILSKGRLIVGKRAYLMMKTKPRLYIPDYDSAESFYNKILGIGETNEDEAIDQNGANISVSERFRTS